MRSANHITKCRSFRTARRRMVKAWRHVQTDADGYLDELYRHEAAWAHYRARFWGADGLMAYERNQ